LPTTTPNPKRPPPLLLSPHALYPPTCNTELLEGCFLVLDTLSLANPDLAGHISQLRTAALTAPPALGPDAEMRLLQRQTTGRQALAALAGFIERNQQLVATMSTSNAAAAVSAGVPGGHGHGGLQAMPMGMQQLQPGAGMLGGAGANLAAPGTSPVLSLSPSRDTPLASFFASGAGGASNCGSGPLDTISLTTTAAPGGSYSPQPRGQHGSFSPLHSAGLGAELLESVRRTSGGAMGQSVLGAQQMTVQLPMSAQIPQLAAVSMPLA